MHLLKKGSPPVAYDVLWWSLRTLPLHTRQVTSIYNYHQWFGSFVVGLCYVFQMLMYTLRLCCNWTKWYWRHKNLFKAVIQKTVCPPAVSEGHVLSNSYLQLKLCSVALLEVGGKRREKKKVTKERWSLIMVVSKQVFLLDSNEQNVSFYFLQQSLKLKHHIHEIFT